MTGGNILFLKLDRVVCKTSFYNYSLNSVFTGIRVFYIHVYILYLSLKHSAAHLQSLWIRGIALPKD